MSLVRPRDNPWSKAQEAAEWADKRWFLSGDLPDLGYYGIPPPSDVLRKARFIKKLELRDAGAQPVLKRFSNLEVRASSIS